MQIAQYAKCDFGCARGRHVPSWHARSRSLGGVNLAFDDRGSGDPVLFIAGKGGAGRTWHIHQVPAFLAAGYRAITFDNRGIGATEQADGFGVEQMVADTAALIEKLDAAPARIVAVSMGAFIAQELMLARPELVRSAVLLATRGRHDRTRDFFRTAERELAASGVELPAAFDAKIRLLESFSPKTLNDDTAVRDWIDMFTVWPTKSTPGLRAQLDIGPRDNRLPAYRSISRWCRPRTISWAASSAGRILRRSGRDSLSPARTRAACTAPTGWAATGLPTRRCSAALPATSCRAGSAPIRAGGRRTRMCWTRSARARSIPSRADKET